MFLTDPCFLSIDGRNGVYFQALYPGFIREEDGNYTLVTSTASSYEDPVYSIQSIFKSPWCFYPGHYSIFAGK